VRDANDHTAGESRISHVGSFRFLFDTQEWEWSDEVAEMHGYRPGEVTPTTELIAGHKHPDDLAASIVRLLDATGRALVSRLCADQWPVVDRFRDDG
jgi:hypothetical protein